jgi:thiol-disulfide isomerase/thioredoxin
MFCSPSLIHQTETAAEPVPWLGGVFDSRCRRLARTGVAQRAVASFVRSYRMKIMTWTVLSVIVLTLTAVLGHGTAALSDDSPSATVVKLERLNWQQLQSRLAANKNIKYTIVDAWSTTCGPCKENFPHVVEMYRKYASKGRAVISLSLDDPTDKVAVAEAERFLKAKKAICTNVLLDENFGDGFDKLKISAIPAVFLYGPDGKEVKRFTLDDPNNQFTYDDVEKTIVALLDAKS